MGIKTAPRVSVCDPLASAAGAAAFFRPLLGGGGSVWLGSASVGAEARLGRVFFGAGGLGVLAGSWEVAALEARGGLVRVLFAGGMVSDGSACWFMDIWGWSDGGGVETADSAFRLRLTIDESWDQEESLRAHASHEMLCIWYFPWSHLKWLINDKNPDSLEKKRPKLRAILRSPIRKTKGFRCSSWIKTTKGPQRSTTTDTIVAMQELTLVCCTKSRRLLVSDLVLPAAWPCQAEAVQPSRAELIFWPRP